MIQQPDVDAAPVLKTDVLLAGFWRRVLAYLIDSALLIGVDFAILATLLIVAPDSIDPGFNSDAVCASTGMPGGLIAGCVAVLKARYVLSVCGVLALAYFSLMESSPARGTLGKLALGLYVADVHGDPVSFRRAAWRNLLKGWLQLFGLGWVVAAFTPRKQALHDMLAGTLVLRKVDYFVLGRETPSEPGDYWDGARWVASVPPMERT
jgi:uncharacterized RDD family membrane protein YckC